MGNDLPGEDRPLADLHHDVTHLGAPAGLSFLGLGAQPPLPEWGALLTSSRVYLARAPGLVDFPGLAILATVLGLNLLGNALRDVLNPRLR